MCLQAPKMANSHFCSQPCIDDAENKGPMILEVPFGHLTFKSGLFLILYRPKKKVRIPDEVLLITLQWPNNSRPRGDT